MTSDAPAPSAAPSRRPRRVARLLLLLAACLPIAVLSRQTAPSSAQSEGAAIVDACGSTNPFIALSHFAGAGERGAGDAPAVLAVQDNPGDDASAQRILARHEQVGAVYGLAYDAASGQLYAAAYHKRGVAFGPAGPGGIYRIDLSSGAVSAFASLQAGLDRHRWQDDDLAAADWVGRTSLGDIELDAEGGQLLVANLYDGRIHRLSLADGSSLGSFRHGAADEAWANRARLFGLALADGWLYHGLIDTTGRSEADDYPVAQVYRSRPDGSALSSLFNVNLGYGERSWLQPWVSAMPMLTDLEVRPDGSLVMGLRNQALDAEFGQDASQPPTLPVGGAAVVALVEPDPDDPDAGTEPTWTVLDPPPISDPTVSGGLARLPGLDQIAAPALRQSVLANPGDPPPPREPNPRDPNPRPETRLASRGLLVWFDAAAGAETRTERIVDAGSGQPAAVAMLGDAEVLCAAQPRLDPDLVATATQEAVGAGTATRQAAGTMEAGTATAVVPTLTAYATRYSRTATAAAGTGTVVAQRTATASAEDLDIIQRSCGTNRPYFVVTCFARDGVTGRLSREPAIVAFNGRAPDHFPLLRQLDVGAIYGLAYDWRESQLYMGAYHKRGAILGPEGTGAIYRLDLRNGQHRLWQQLNAGPIIHRYQQTWDEVAAPWVGKLGLGDIELSEDGGSLFVTNLYDGLIYRFSTAEGHLVDTFSHGARQEVWARDARPMALGYRHGWLYHGVTYSGELLGGRMEAVVYRSRDDGSAMEEVTRVDLGYRTEAPWGPWRYPVAQWRQPMLSDIEWALNGDLLLGFRDRNGDSELFSVGYGDLLPSRLEPPPTPAAGEPTPIPGGPRPERWLPAQTRPEFYRDNLIHNEPLWGGLAAFPSLELDWIVTTALDPLVIFSGGAIWYDNDTGRYMRRETIYQSNQAELTFGKAAGLGDVESLCPPLEVPPPTATPLPSPTSTATSTATPTATATRTPSATATSTLTPEPQPIYLPLIDNRPCKPEERFTDAVLVLDMSTSMYRQTRGGRSKHAAALEAARSFIQQLDLEPDHLGRQDRVGIVGFNDAAWTGTEMTGDQATAFAALDGLLDRIAQGTRLDLALAEGQRVVESAARSPLRGTETSAVMILLTDGLPNRVPFGPGSPYPGCQRQECSVLEVASRAKSAGTRLFTIGLGQENDVLRDLLVEAASDPADYYFAPDGEDLEAIYRQIAGRINTCP